MWADPIKDCIAEIQKAKAFIEKAYRKAEDPAD
jgi:L-ribulose-5-phosphate 3-epimerase UlaE